VLASLAVAAASQDVPARPIEIGSRLEPFVDHSLIGRMEGTRLALHPPREEAVALEFDKPWEGRFCGYCTVIHDGSRYRLYYRGHPVANGDGAADEVTCYAESTDGKRFTRPNVGLYEVHGTRENNVVLAQAAPVTHNFSPFLDARPGVPADERYKALGGTRQTGLIPFASADGLRWRRLSEKGVITAGAFDSQNVAFWSVAEGQYVCYFRVFKRIGNTGYRWISRTTSKDFLTWTPPVEMSFGDAPPEHLYTNQTSPYFRAPHIYLSTAARFFPGRQVLTEEQARAINVDPGYFKDTSDAVLMTTRGGDRYDRTFLEGFIRPGIGPGNWVSRTNYPALNIVQTGPDEMSLYVQQNYGQPTARLRRYSMRLDGLASVQAPYAGGEMVTRPFTFRGSRLVLNFATSAAGGIRVEFQDPSGTPLPGFTLADARETIGNEIEREVAWKAGPDVSSLAGKPVRARFVMKDADLYSLRFR
jgi:hypothetical protein